MNRIESFLLRACFIAVISLTPLKLATAETTNPASNAQDIRYLLVFKALSHHQNRERNFYELAHEITGFIDGRIFPPSGIITSEEVRYGVTKIMKTKVLKNANSSESPKSSKNGFYVLVYNSVYKLCAKNYSIDIKNKSRKIISYTDCEDGNKYEFPIKTHRSFKIFEIEISPENILRQIWEQNHRSN